MNKAQSAKRTTEATPKKRGRSEAQKKSRSDTSAKVKVKERSLTGRKVPLSSIKSNAAKILGSIGGAAGVGESKVRGTSRYYSRLAKQRWNTKPICHKS